MSTTLINTAEPIQTWHPNIERYHTFASKILAETLALGMTQAEVSIGSNAGFFASVRMGIAEVIEYHRGESLSLTVYKGQRRGNASTTDCSPSAIEHTIRAACHIASLTQSDSASGLAEADRMAYHYPDLDLYHPWPISPNQAIKLAQECESQARTDPRIHNSEGVGIHTTQTMSLYANTHGFTGSYLSTRHGINCSLVAKDKQGNMQRDGSYTISRNPHQLQSLEQLAVEASTKAIRRLGVRNLKTCQAPVIFEAEAANSLIRHFLDAISGSALYSKASFLLNQKNQLVFPPSLQIQERPHMPQGLGSAPFDAEGVATQDRDLIVDGVLKDYLLSSYSARRLGLNTTGNAGGAHNIIVNSQMPDLASLLKEMDTGLLVTELLGNGVNIVTGDYSQGAIGFWIEKGQIQYPVEVTIADNLRKMYRGIVAVSGDVNMHSSIMTGSILIDKMTIADSA